MRVYYAHCLAIYNTPQETRDLMTLERLGFNVLNPNRAVYQEHADRMKKQGDDVLVNVFFPLVKECDVFAFRALPDGAIPSGVAEELRYARSHDIPVLELPSATARRTIGLAETREYLLEVGQR